MLEQGICKSTADKYERSRKNHWLVFLARKGLEGNPLMVGYAYEKQLDLLLLFMAEWSKEKKSTGVIGDALYAIRSNRLMNGLSVEVFEDPLLGLGKRGCMRMESRGEGASKRPKRLPVTFDMLLYMMDKLWHGFVDGHRADVDTQMIFVGAFLAFHFMLRVSEYVFHYESEKRDPSHAIEAKHVEFICKIAVPGRGAMLVRLKPWEVRERNVAASSVVLVKLFIRDSKMDQFGERGRNLLVSNEKGENEKLLVQVLYRWCFLSGIREGDPFLSRRKATKVCKYSRACLQRKDLINELKAVAKFFNLEQIFFSSHCFRIGGATTMASAGASRDRIKRIAAWLSSSDCDLIYEQFNGLDGGVLSLIDECGVHSEEAVTRELKSLGQVLSAMDVFHMQPVAKGSLEVPARDSSVERSAPAKRALPVTCSVSSQMKDKQIKRSMKQGCVDSLQLHKPSYI